MSSPWPAEGRTYVPLPTDQPKAPDPLPGTKRFVALDKDGELVAEADEVVSLIGFIGIAVMICDRHPVINKYCTMRPYTRE